MKNFSYTSPLVENGNYEIFVKPDLYPLTEKEYQQLKEYAEFVQWGRNNLTQCAREILGIEYLDYQAYTVEQTWLASFAVWQFCRNGSKSTTLGGYIMLRSLLIPNHHTYIASSIGAQSIDTFTKIISLTQNALPSFKSLTNCFSNELVRSQAKSDGFIRDPSSYHFTLFNGSTVHTLNSNIDGVRGKRANLVVFDEAAVCSDYLFDTVEPFATQNSKFSLGVDFDDTRNMMEPDPFPNQIIYASSAGRTDQYFWKKYRECSLRMDAGDRRYFCIDLNADAIINATKNGVKLSEPLLTQETVDSALRKNKVAAMREYYNIPTSEGSDQQIIKRATIIRNSYPYLPEFYNRDDGSLYAIAYDPARRQDNSNILIARFWEDKNVGWKMRIVNDIVLMDRMSASKRMMTTPNQVEELKRIILDYNGRGVSDYENILSVSVDAGSGGAGVNITDFLADDWDIDGNTHRGMIDVEFNEGDDRKFPNAVKNVLHLISPAKFKAEMYEEAIQMTEQGLVEFPEEYTSRGYIDLIYEVDGNGSRKMRTEYPSEKEEKELKRKGVTVETTRHTLSDDEERALIQIEALKTEVVNIYRFKTTTGKDRFELAPDKVGELNDDRAYCYALMCHVLSQLRRKAITERKRTDIDDDFVSRLPMRKGVREYMIG